MTLSCKVFKKPMGENNILPDFVTVFTLVAEPKKCFVVFYLIQEVHDCKS